MDPISQAVIGAAAAALVCKPQQRRRALLLGALAGMAPDLDILIRSSQDPLMALEYHRHFTHSLFFIPIGGWLCAVFFWWLWPNLQRKQSFAEVYRYCLLGWGTHGLLDAFTSYGTQLWWPFASTRVAWDWIAVIDPTFTLPAILLLLVAALNQRATGVIAAVCWMSGYLSLGAWQHSRAMATAEAFFHAAGQAPARLEAKPTLGNLVAWRILIAEGDQVQVALVRTPWLDKPWVIAGDRLPAWQARDSLALPPHYQADIARFAHFSHNWLVRLPTSAEGHWRLGDARYAYDPLSLKPLWGLAFDPAGLHPLRFEKAPKPQHIGERLWHLWWAQTPEDYSAWQEPASR
jgi:inner membrane protein